MLEYIDEKAMNPNDVSKRTLIYDVTLFASFIDHF